MLLTIPTTITASCTGTVICCVSESPGNSSEFTNKLTLFDSSPRWTIIYKFISMEST